VIGALADGFAGFDEAQPKAETPEPAGTVVRVVDEQKIGHDIVRCAGNAVLPVREAIDLRRQIAEHGVGIERDHPVAGNPTACCPWKNSRRNAAARNIRSNAGAGAARPPPRQNAPATDSPAQGKAGKGDEDVFREEGHVRFASITTANSTRF